MSASIVNNGKFLRRSCMKQPKMERRLAAQEVQAEELSDSRLHNVYKFHFFNVVNVWGSRNFRKIGGKLKIGPVLYVKVGFKPGGYSKTYPRGYPVVRF